MSWPLISVGLALLFVQHALCRDFNMWPYMDADSYAQALDVDAQCLAAINASLPCPEPFLTYASEADFYWWGPDNLTQLCTPSCSSSLPTWVDNVIDACGQQNVLLHGSHVKAHTLPLMYSHGHDTACLTSSSGDYCMLERQGWQGQEAISYSGDYCLYGEGAGDMPECSDPDFDPTDVTKDMTRMANVYSKDLLCSDCFLKVFHNKLESPFLPAVNYTDYLLDEWEDMQQVCSTTIALQTKSSTLYVGQATKTGSGVAQRSAQITPRAIVERSVDGYADLGCYTDADSRTLPDANTSGADMTLESCASYCSTAGYKIFGVENGGECWCSNTISSAGTSQSASNCNAACAGNAQETCGGGWALNVYSSTTAAPPSSTPTLAPSNVSGYSYVGCYSDQDDRTLGDSSTTDVAMTSTKCAAICGTDKYFGVEYGQECHCGGSINPIAKISTSCDKACAGDAEHRCGGGWALDVYSSSPPSTPTFAPEVLSGYKYVGCYSDADNRTLADSSTTDVTLTAAKCAAFCGTDKYFGVEYGQECHCGSTMNSIATISSSCDRACGGDASYRCGGSWALDIYSLTPATTTTSSSGPTITSSLVPSVLSGYTYVGCYSDADDRTLGGKSTTDSGMTAKNCATFCGTDYFGVEYGEQCYCGSSLNPSASVSTLCDVACAGDSQHRCGGGWALDLYSVASPAGPGSTAGSTTTRSAPPAATTCPGQLVKTADENGLPYGCAAIASKYHVSTGAIMYATDDKLCDVDTTICLPLPCTVDQIGFTESCASLVTKYYTEENNLTQPLFLSWNPNIVGFCQSLLGGQHVCTSPPGGLVALDVPAYNPTGTTGYYTTVKPAQPTPTGTTGSCGLYHNVVANDVCQTIALRYKITLDQFFSLNTEILPDCSNLWLGYSYCVYGVSPPLVSADGSCGSQHNNAQCEGSSFGNCCNQAGRCGSGDAFCTADVCQSGQCLNGTLTPDGSCGPSNHYYVCPDASCCSIYGYCGEGEDFCGPGKCSAGACDPDEGGISVDGSCGPLFAGDKTCTGSQFGKCCSASGYCGDSDDYCKGSNCHSGACN